MAKADLRSLPILRSKLDNSVSDQITDDFSLMRWLKIARNDQDQAAKLVKNHSINRKLYELDVEESQLFRNEQLSHFWPLCWTATSDKDGSPLVIRRAGKVDIKGMLRSVKTSDQVRHEMCQSERIMRQLRHRSLQQRRIVGTCLILDLEGLEFDLKSLKELISYFQMLEDYIVHQNFPLLDEKIVIVNAPKLIHTVHSVIEKVWQGAKVHILGKNYQRKLFELVEPKNVPKSYGGSLDLDKLGSPLVDPQKVPVTLYYDSKVMDPPNLSKVFIKPRSYVRFITAQFVSIGSKISWFVRGDHEIGFSIWCRNSYTKSVDELVLPKHKCKTDIVAESGIMTCLQEGIYIIELDNSHNKVLFKTVLVAFSVLSPNGEYIDLAKEEK